MSHLQIFKAQAYPLGFISADALGDPCWVLVNPASGKHYPFSEWWSAMQAADTFSESGCWLADPDGISYRRLSRA